MTEEIGFIGQGWIGKHYADDFESRGFRVVRYALEEPYRENKEAVSRCGIVFIAVPTPTTRDGFDASAVRDALALVGRGKIAVVKSTLLPGTTEDLQREFPDRIVLHSPEFLRERSAAHDAAHPARNIIGLPERTEAHETAAVAVLAVLPPAPYARVMDAKSAELAKYAGNVFLALKVVYANLLYDLSQKLGIEYADIEEALGADPRIGPSHLSPVLASGHADHAGRGAGGHCFIKDLEAFRALYEERADDALGSALLAAAVRKNNALLSGSGKDADLLRSVYGASHELLP